MVNLKDKIVLRGAGVVQNVANSRKETTKAVLDTQGREGLQTPVLVANQESGTAVASRGCSGPRWGPRPPLPRLTSTASRGL